MVGWGCFVIAWAGFTQIFECILKIIGIVSRRPDLIRDCDLKDLAYLYMLYICMYKIGKSKENRKFQN